MYEKESVQDVQKCACGWEYALMLVVVAAATAQGSPRAFFPRYLRELDLHRFLTPRNPSTTNNFALLYLNTNLVSNGAAFVTFGYFI